MDYLIDRKILSLLHLPPPDYGVTLLNRDILNKYLLKHFRVDYLSINTSRKLSDIEKFSFEKIIIILRIFLKLLKKIMVNRYRFCYFTITPTGIGFYKDFLLVILLKIFRIKIIYHLHGKGISRRNNLLDRILYRICFNNSNVIIMSELLFYDIKKYVNRRNIYILPNGINNYSLGDICINRTIDSSRREPVKLLFLSNMIKSKGVFIALEAVKIINLNNCDFKFYFAGDWYDISKNEFINKINEFNLNDKIEYLGFKSGEEKYKALADADIFVYPTLKDTFPLVLLEAMQFGLPTVSTYEGAIPEIIDDGVNGFLIDKNNPAILADKISFLIANPDLRIKMGKAARRKFLQEYTFDIFGKRLVDIFHKTANPIE